MVSKLKYQVIISLLVAALVGCSSGGAFIDGEAPEEVIEELDVRLGSGFSPFSEGLVEVAQPLLSAGGSTLLRLRVVDNDGAPFVSDGLSAAFSSPCSAQGLGEFSEAAGSDPSNKFAFNDEGAINIIYTDRGCSASAASQVSNPISAKVEFEGVVLSAEGSVSVQPGSAGSIQLVEPLDATELALKGADASDNRPQSVEVVFRVVDDSGAEVPVAGQLVCFQLNTDVGGLALSANEAVTQANGLVSTTLQAGNVPAAVVVTASVAGAAGESDCAALGADVLSTQNGNIVVSTGLPDQDGFDVVVDVHNPEALSINNVKVPVTVSLNDLFNNPVRDGVIVFFTTEGGTIQDQCSTVEGACTVEWNSSGDRPFDGRSTVTAYTIGEETFVDTNGNGLFDDGEPFGDLPEPFFDADEDGVRSQGLKCPGSDVDDPRCDEEFADFNSNSVHDLGDGEFNGTRCQQGCSAEDSIYVWGDAVIQMASSTPEVRITPSSIFIPQDGAVDVLVEVFATMADGSEQILPFNTSVDFATDAGEILGAPSSTIPNTARVGPTEFRVTIKDSGDPALGNFRVSVTPPSGVVSEFAAPILQP